MSPRSEFIGSSDIAAVMGLSRYTTPLKLWAQKTGVLPETPDNEYMELGRELEDFVAKKFERKTGYKIRRDTRDFRHPLHNFLAAHIDRWIIGGATLECKTASAYLAREWAGDEIPQEYILQVQWQLGILGHKEGWIACLIGGNHFIYKRLEFNQELFDNMVKTAVSFWNDHIVANVPPLAISGDKDTLSDIHPESYPRSLLLTGDAETELNQLVESRKGGKEQLEAIEKEVDGIENRLRQIVADNEAVETGQYRVTWKSQSRTQVDVDKLKTEGIYDKYSIVKQIRVLRTNAQKGTK